MTVHTDDHLASNPYAWLARLGSSPIIRRRAHDTAA